MFPGNDDPHPCMEFPPNAAYKTVGYVGDCEGCHSQLCWLQYLRWEIKLGIKLNAESHYLVKESR